MGVADEGELLAAYPAPRAVAAAEVAAAVAASPRVLVVLDDDPTGTQSVAGLPVLTRWEREDFRWAFRYGVEGVDGLPRIPSPAVYVLTNTRSLGPDEAHRRNRECVVNALAAARETATEVGFVSRSDSTLRGHFPLEPDVIAATLLEVDGTPTDAVVLVPAFPDAGRITIGGVHYMRDGDRLSPVAETEFARDATYPFQHSELAAYVEEKSAGRYRRDDVVVLDLGLVRGGTDGIADALDPLLDATPVVVDAVTEDDLRALALGLDAAERRGKRLLYRVGPPFVRSRVGQNPHAPLTRQEALGDSAAPGGGLVVVGSHVGLTTRQLATLHEGHPAGRVVLSVPDLLDPARSHAHLDDTVAAVVERLGQGDVVLATSRELVRSDDPGRSLEIARTVSAAVVDVVRRVLARRPPRFVVAKGGITSSDVAAHGLQIRHGVVRGPMLPGIVSLWEAVDGPGAGIPFVVFAGNVGDDDSLLQVVRTLSSSSDDTGAREAGR